MATEKPKISTQHFPVLICNDELLFETLQSKVQWCGEILRNAPEGIQPLQPARFIYVPTLESPRSFIDELIMTVVIRALYDAKIELKNPIKQGEIVVRYYRDGYHFFPSFSDKKHRTFIISLGEGRTTFIGKSTYCFESGDGIIFGTPNYRIPVERGVREPYMTITVTI